MTSVLRSTVFCALLAIPLAAEPPELESDPDALDPESYRLAVEEQARIWSRDEMPRFIVWPTQAFDIQLQRSFASIRAAEEAARLDERNAYAQALLARYFLVPDDTLPFARESWEKVFAHGGGVSFPSLFYDVDTKRYFMSHIRRDGIYVYRFGQFGVESMTELPDETNQAYWRAHAGHLPSDLEPDAVIKWSNVRRIKTGNWVWWLKLDEKVTLRSDRGKEKTTDEIKVALLGGVGKFDWHLDWYDFWRRGDVKVRTHSYGPADYNARLRSVVLALVYPEGRIEAPAPKKPGPGW